MTLLNLAYLTAGFMLGTCFRVFVGFTLLMKDKFQINS